MRVIQLLPSLSMGDGVGNDCLAIKDMLRRNGFDTEIYAEHIDPRLGKKAARPAEELPDLDEKDVVIYHLSTGTQLNYEVAKLKAKLIIRYHNVTPPEYFADYDIGAYQNSKSGLAGVRFLGEKARHVMAVSAYNKEDLVKMGYREEGIQVFPILIPFEDYEKKADRDLVASLKDGRTNIIFTGRLVPNKKQQELIKTFYYYKKYYDKEARLFIVGTAPIPIYEMQLKQYVEKLGLSDVYFTGHVKFNQILAYYRIADIYLCMSEHEGFCIPLVEAMYFKIPIIAYDSSAVGETLGGAGILLKEKNCLLMAGAADRIRRDDKLRQVLIEGEQERLKQFMPERIEYAMMQYIRSVIEEEP